ncbi:hypothetical protein Bbelb_349220 [Branchiostoma belcheri]|nr:hypothetical protein Bbelb_349220 [Branchiostoma belcheri]
MSLELKVSFTEAGVFRRARLEAYGPVCSLVQGLCLALVCNKEEEIALEQALTLRDAVSPPHHASSYVILHRETSEDSDGWRQGVIHDVRETAWGVTYDCFHRNTGRTTSSNGKPSSPGSQRAGWMDRRPGSSSSPHGGTLGPPAPSLNIANFITSWSVTTVSIVQFGFLF